MLPRDTVASRDRRSFSVPVEASSASPRDGTGTLQRHRQPTPAQIRQRMCQEEPNLRARPCASSAVSYGRRSGMPSANEKRDRRRSRRRRGWKRGEDGKWLGAGMGGGVYI
ncbi:hypothetical protein GWI33_006631 [Rhynchophorus ferrugineus]|uniref:Uncharacterized protein n=1 Tax=Rhynchophorus ferrugineus TaxID=354439 RepID=A0A834MH63_RHYFE|nr:hypothetical protein GWI33_006631 [Rhynchophorus ferrugineus]